MRPDTSCWRDKKNYDFFDDLAIEGLAWECLRRHQPYQHQYQALVAASAEMEPFSPEVQQQWGLRFSRTTKFVRFNPKGILVSRCCTLSSDICAPAGAYVARRGPGTLQGSRRS
ncbi:DUF6499 domain-containing protein [Aquamicrobium lusatiense]|uniref:transcriptional regulator domain-containing protein n=1 Tax=Aquamicrobium lusatiense TaxID=89772 RepID=UPI0024548C2F|nr:DUF6499 domain-containing protein [Aquamicrobium lusatiense]MDH4993155.1 DUF6499 domain-containing protein [Aquamicrobium lusatiense]